MFKCWFFDKKNKKKTKKSRNSDYNAFTYSNFYSVDKINNFKFL